MKPLTKKQQDFFEFLCRFSKENGFPPTYSDMMENFGFSSDGTVRTYLEQLEKKGFIERLGQARGIRILRPSEHSSIPIIGRIAAGNPILAVEDCVGNLEDIKELQLQPGRYALTVNGDSMKDAGIIDGDLAIIQTGVPIYNGQIAAIILDEDATLKRVYYEKDQVRLQPENEFYEPLYIHKGTFGARLIGRYIALVRKA